jgi:hypothetical protein
MVSSRVIARIAAQETADRVLCTLGAFFRNQPELFPKLALDLARLKVDVIFARGTWALAAAKNATPTIPIVG